MKLEKALHIIDLFVQHGWDIEFDINDQYIDNDNTKASPRYTYTPYIYLPDPSHKETDYDYIDEYEDEYKKSYNSLASMYIDIASKLEKRVLGNNDKKE